jgi:hypothetical protein
MIKNKEKAGEKTKDSELATKASSKVASSPASQVTQSPAKASAPDKSSVSKASTKKTLSDGDKPVRKSPARKAVRDTSPVRKTDSGITLEDLGPLPRSYGEEAIFLIAQDPHWLFTYWDIEISRHPGGPCHLRVVDAAGQVEQEIEVSFEARNWYVPVKKAGATYSVEIGFYRANKWNVLERSAKVETPRDRLSESDQFDFATLPLHVSFQRLVETISHSFASEQNLVPALSLLQKSLAGSQSSGIPLEDHERQILTTLLGSDFLSGLASGRWSSGDLHSAVYQRLRERLSSGELGELIGRLNLSQAETSLSSAFNRFSEELASRFGNVSSSGFAEKFTESFSSWLAMTLTSWMSAAQSSWSGGASDTWLGSSETLARSSSGLLAGGGSESFARGASGLLVGGSESFISGGSETIGGLARLSSWFGGELSSMSATTSWGALSSWLTEVNSAWSGVNMSSFAQAALSSWSNEVLSSYGFAGSSSWGSSENSAGLAAARAFEFQLDAEITVRGQTHPQGRVLIAGEQVTVRPDGSFEHTLVFSGGSGQVPIEAISPDGVHTRRTAILLQPASI